MTLFSLGTKALVALLTLQSTAYAGKSQQVSNWGDNPSKLPAMLVYTPDKLATKPAVVLGLHPCGGTGQQYYQMTNMGSYADKYGFVALFPTSNSQSGINCWDVHSAKSLRHNGGGDSEGLAGAVAWALKTYSGDASKVFVVGGSSGAMATNVMAATYPDVFNAGVSYSGVAAGCFAGQATSAPGSSSPDCKEKKSYTAAQWGQLAKDSYSGYTGNRTRMMIVHGTADSVVPIPALKAQLDQWSNVLGVSFSRNVSNDPISNWKKIVYGDGSQLVGYEVQGGGHIPAFQGDSVMKFWGFA